MRTAAGWIAGAVLLGAALGCGDARATDAGVVVRDSAGVRIVENREPQWTPGDEWRIGAEPTLTIGTVEGDPATMFSVIRSVVRLPDGSIVVLDGGSNQLRLFDASGRFLAKVGREGNGPAEFTFIGKLWRRPGDTLVVTDLSRRLQYFDHGARYLGAKQLADVPGSQVIGQADDGTLLAISGGRLGREDAGRVISGVNVLTRYDADGSGGIPLDTLPAQERWGLRSGGQVSFPYLPFSAPTAWVVGGDRFIAGTAGVGELLVWQSDGRLAQRIRWPGARRPVTDDDRARYREAELAAAQDDNERRRTEQFLAEAPWADSMPAFRSLKLDADGDLWVELYRAPWETERRWQIFAPDGRWLGRLVTPTGLIVMDIGRDYLLGLWRDENDVEYVRMYPLEKGDA
jgi:hypothetical protein